MARKFRRTLTTGLIAVGFALLSWMVIVMSLDSRVEVGGNLLWAASLWLSATASTIATSYVRFRDYPVLGCTVAFGAFSLGYFLCEGPIFGNVSSGGDPKITELVFWNMVFLPLGVFLASELGSRLGSRRHLTDARQPLAPTED
jgi:hypothetical protein